MAGTVIDALFVTLGLDAKAFITGKNQVTDATKKLSAEETKATKDIETRNKAAAESFKKVRNEVLALLAVFTAGMGLKDFTESTIGAAVNLGYMAKNLQMSTQDLSAWQRAAERAGGSAEGITNTLQDSQQQIAGFRLGKVSDQIQMFLRFGGKTSDLKDGNSFLLARAKIVQNLFNVDPARAKYVAQAMGISGEEFNFIKQGPQAILALVAAQEKNSAITEKQAEQALKLKNAWLDLRDRLQYVGTTILLELIPVFETWLQKLQKMADWVADHKADISLWVENAVTSVQKFVQWADKAADSVGGWKNVLIALAALKILSIATPLLQLAAALSGVGGGLASIALSGPGAIAALAGVAVAAELARKSAFDKAIAAGPNHDQYVAEAMAGGIVTPDVAQPPAGGFGKLGELFKQGPHAPRGIRNNNPGNIRYGDFAYKNGATGRDSGGFAIFPSMEAGVAAQRALLQNYLLQGNDTIRKVVSKYAPSSENDTSGYIAEVSRKLGVGADQKLSSANIDALSSAIFAREVGAKNAADLGSAAARANAGLIASQSAGARGAGSWASRVSSMTSSAETNINGPITIHTQATDAQGIAKEFGKAVGKYSFTVPQANTGLT